MGHFVGCGVLVADKEFWILISASRDSEKSQNEMAKSEGWLYCNRIPTVALTSCSAQAKTGFLLLWCPKYSKR